MDIIKLTKPCKTYKQQIEEFKKKFFDNGEPVIDGSGMLDQLEFDSWLENTIRNSSEETVKDDWAVTDLFLGIRESDKKIVGIIDLRHTLANENLRNYWGNVGYSVVPEERRKGYAVRMLQLVIDYARKIDIDDLMIACFSDNSASKKTILKCGGHLTEQKNYLDGKPMEVYHITIND